MSTADLANKTRTVVGDRDSKVCRYGCNCRECLEGQERGIHCKRCLTILFQDSIASYQSYHLKRLERQS